MKDLYVYINKNYMYINRKIYQSSKLLEWNIN